MNLPQYWRAQHTKLLLFIFAWEVMALNLSWVLCVSNSSVSIVRKSWNEKDTVVRKTNSKNELESDNMLFVLYWENYFIKQSAPVETDVHRLSCTKIANKALKIVLYLWNGETLNLQLLFSGTLLEAGRITNWLFALSASKLQISVDHLYFLHFSASESFRPIWG